MLPPPALLLLVALFRAVALHLALRLALRAIRSRLVGNRATVPCVGSNSSRVQCLRLLMCMGADVLLAVLALGCVAVGGWDAWVVVMTSRVFSMDVTVS